MLVPLTFAVMFSIGGVMLGTVVSIMIMKTFWKNYQNKSYPGNGVKISTPQQSQNMDQSKPA